MSFTLDNPFQYWNNPNNSNPVGLGKLYVGLPDTDPVTPANQVTVKAVQPDGSELVLTQPVQLLAGGVPSFNGSPVQLKIDAETVSVKVTTLTGAQVYYTARWNVSVDYADLAAVDSTVLIAGVPARQLKIASGLKSLIPTNNISVLTKSFYQSGISGGGVLYYDPLLNKSQHNGVTIYAPEAIAAWNGTQADLPTLLNWSGVGGGAWRRVDTNCVTFEMGGAVLDADPSSGTGTNNTLSVNKVFSTGLPVVFTRGYCKLTDKVTMQTLQKMTGSGRQTSMFVISTDFNLLATSVLRMGAGEPSSQVADVGFSFVQANQGVRANATKYPWAIDVSGSPRFMLDGIRIEGAWNGVNATGNTGGAIIGTMEIGALNEGFKVDGALDFFHVKTLHFWPFGFTSKPLLLDNVYYDGVGTSLIFGMCDGADFGTVSMFRTKMEITNNATSGISNSFNRIQLDGDGARLLINGGLNSISQLYSTKSGTNTTNAIICSGGLTTIDDAQILGDNPQVDVLTNGGTLNIDGGSFLWNNLGNPKVLVSSGALSIRGCKIRNYTEFAYTQPFARQLVDGELVFADNAFDLKTTGSGTAIEYTDDNFGNYCMNNRLSGYLISVPANSVQGVYQGAVSYSPEVAGTTSAGSASYTVQQGFFEHLSDDLVTYSASVTYSGHTGTGGTTITLPHNLANFGQRVSQSVYSADVNFGAGRQLSAFVGTSGNKILVRALDPSGGAVVDFFDPSGTFNISGIYRRA